MKFNLKQFIVIGLLAGLIVAIYSAAMQVEMDQTYSMIAFSPDGEKIAVQGTFSTQVFEVNGRKMAAFDVYSAETPEYVEFADNQHLLSCGFSRLNPGPPKVRWHELASRKLAREIELAQLHEHFTPALDGFLHTNNQTQEVIYYSRDPQQLKPLFHGRFRTLRNLTALQYHPYYQIPNHKAFFNIAAQNLRDERQIFDPELETSFKSLNEVLANVRISPQQQRIAIETPDGLTLYDIASGAKKWFHEGVKLQRARFSHGGRFIGCDCKIEGQNGVRIWDVETGKLLFSRISERNFMGTPFAISDQGLVAMAVADTSRDGIEIWDAKNGKLLHTIAVSNSQPERQSSQRTSFLLLLGWCVLWCWAQGRQQRVPRYRLGTLSLLIYLTMGIFLLFSGNAAVWTQESRQMFSPEIVGGTLYGVLGLAATALSLRALRLNFGRMASHQAE